MIDRTRGLKDVLWFLIFCGGVAMAFRLWYGLGATTNLSDEVPWGLWKILNMVAGVALATSGFTVGFLVYVLRLESLRPLMKPAVLVACLGYGSSIFALCLDIGLPHRIWHPVFMWNGRSFLFEVAWCVMLYFTVAILELSPTLLERFGLSRIAGFLHRVAPAVVITGIALSCLHHSSLGSLFLVTPQRLHPLWFTPRIPFHFIVSAMAAGLMVAVLAKLLYAYLYDPESVFGAAASERRASLCVTNKPGTAPARGRDFAMLQRLASIAAFILALYLILKIGDLIVVGAVPHLLSVSWESYLYFGELTVLAIVPVLLLLNPGTRNSPSGIGWAAACAAVGLVWNRLNVGIFGYLRDAGTAYFPSLAEWALSLGILAAGGRLFLYLCECLPIFDDAWQGRRRQQACFLPAFDRISGVWHRALTGGMHRTSLIAVLTIPVAWALLYPPFNARTYSGGDRILPPLAVDKERSILSLDGNRRLMAVRFPHRQHQQRLAEDRSCLTCHHLSLPQDQSTPCSRCHRFMRSETRIFDHSAHFLRVAGQKKTGGLVPANHSCEFCHAKALPKRKSTAVSCLLCHREDMHPEWRDGQEPDLQWACGYQAAMHQTCIACHRHQSERVGRPGLAECSNCHPTATFGRMAARNGVG